MRRLKLSPTKLSQIVNVPTHARDVLLPQSEYRDLDGEKLKETQGSVNTMSIITSVNFYHRRTPRRLEVFTHESEPSPAIVVEWKPGEEGPKTEVVVDSSYTLPWEGAERGSK